MSALSSSSGRELVLALLARADHQLSDALLRAVLSHLARAATPPVPLQRKVGSDGLCLGSAPLYLRLSALTTLK